MLCVRHTANTQQTLVIIDSYYDRMWLLHQPWCCAEMGRTHTMFQVSTFPTFWKVSFHKSDRGILGPWASVRGSSAAVAAKLRDRSDCPSPPPALSLVSSTFQATHAQLRFSITIFDRSLPSTRRLQLCSSSECEIRDSIHWEDGDTLPS